MKKTSQLLFNVSSEQHQEKELGFARGRIEELQSRELKSALPIKRARIGFMEREIT